MYNNAMLTDIFSDHEFQINIHFFSEHKASYNVQRSMMKDIFLQILDSRSMYMSFSDHKASYNVRMSMLKDIFFRFGVQIKKIKILQYLDIIFVN